jgi:hypothetical protein
MDKVYFYTKKEDHVILVDTKLCDNQLTRWFGWLHTRELIEHFKDVEIKAFVLVDDEGCTNEDIKECFKDIEMLKEWIRTKKKHLTFSRCIDCKKIGLCLYLPWWDQTGTSAFAEGEFCEMCQSCIECYAYIQN